MEELKKDLALTNAKINDPGDINRMPDAKLVQKPDYNTDAYYAKMEALEDEYKVKAQDPKHWPTIYPDYQEPVVKKKKPKRTRKK